MKYVSKKGTTINIPDGLSAKQIASIKADADAGYGTRAQKTADALGKKSGSSANAGSGSKNNSFGRKSVDAFLDGLLDNFKPIDYSGAPGILSAQDLEATRQQNQDALYAEETKYLDRDRARSLEEARQEMANRGIPYRPDEAANPNTENLYGKTLGAIEESYRGERQSALNRARTGADERMASQVNANKTARDSFIDSATKQFNSQLDALNSGGNLLNILVNEYGMTREEALAKLQMKSAERIASIGARASGGSGGSGGGFEIAN